MDVPTSAGSSGSALRRVASSPRSLAAWALVAYSALFLFFVFFQWVLADGDFSLNSANAPFLALTEMALPILGVLLAAYVSPELPMARLIATIALIEYAFALFFGTLTLLIGLGAAFSHVNSFRQFVDGLDYLVLGLARVGLVAVAAYITYRTYLSLGGRRLITRAGGASE